MIQIKCTADPNKIAFEISKWLKDQGYVHDLDFTWRVGSANRIVYIAFRDDETERLIDTAIKMRFA
jgi:hypothetical protein